MLIAGCGGGSGGRTSTPSPLVASAEPVRPTIAPPRRVPPSPSLLKLRAALEGALNSAGPQSGAMVYDLGVQMPLFSLRDRVERPPASVEKIYTTVALLRELGPDARLQTTLLGTGHLAAGGVWHGDLYLRGGGDPTFGDGTFNQVWEHGYGPTSSQIVQQLSARGIRRITGAVHADANLFDARRGGPASAFAPDIPDFGGQLSALTYDHGSSIGAPSPDAFAVKELVLTMRAAHIKARAAPGTGGTPAAAVPLASVSSPRLSTLLQLMDVPSDDFFAEMLTKQLGARFGSAGTTADGAQVIEQAVAGYGVHPTIVDGSGLSRADSSSPGEVVDLLRAVWHTPIGHALSEALPIVGVSGTVSRIAVRTPAQGHCIAKTGTLDGVTNLAGYCAGEDTRMLAFALFIDGPPNSRAVGLLGKMVAAIARY
jgi:serine-type D-Ala-D-Ala carboxypeptidase/endopeptidase (penicillin-binding protein 4)